MLDHAPALRGCAIAPLFLAIASRAAEKKERRTAEPPSQDSSRVSFINLHLAMISGILGFLKSAVGGGGFGSGGVAGGSSVIAGSSASAAQTSVVDVDIVSPPPPSSHPRRRLRTTPPLRATGGRITTK
jgi:hypothetical protein